jgi:hypothetical protein
VVGVVLRLLILKEMVSGERRGEEEAGDEDYDYRREAWTLTCPAGLSSQVFKP